MYYNTLKNGANPAINPPNKINPIPTPLNFTSIFGEAPLITIGLIIALIVIMRK